MHHLAHLPSNFTFCIFNAQILSWKRQRPISLCPIHLTFSYAFNHFFNRYTTVRQHRQVLCPEYTWGKFSTQMKVWNKSPCCSERALFNLRPAHVQWTRDCKLLNKRWILIALPPRSVNVNWCHTAAAHLISCNNDKFNLYENIMLGN